MVGIKIIYAGVDLLDTPLVRLYPKSDNEATPRAVK